MPQFQPAHLSVLYAIRAWRLLRAWCKATTMVSNKYTPDQDRQLHHPASHPKLGGGSTGSAGSQIPRRVECVSPREGMKCWIASVQLFSKEDPDFRRLVDLDTFTKPKEEEKWPSYKVIWAIPWCKSRGPAPAPPERVPVSRGFLHPPSPILGSGETPQSPPAFLFQSCRP